VRAERVIKILAIWCFVLIIIALLLAFNSPATGYESSIYAATPLLSWLFFFFSASCGIGIIVHQVWTKKHETSRLWVLGLLLILVSYIAILSLHIIRGYYFWSIGDAATHLGEIQGIVGTGYIGSSNFYPVTHILSAQLSQICGLEPALLLKGLPLLFALIYVAFMYLLAKSLLPHKGGVILVVVAALIPLSGDYLHLMPNRFADLLFPMALFLLVKTFTTGSWQWRALFILMAFLFPVFHPVLAVALAVVLVTMPLAKILFDKIAKSGRKILDSSVKFSAIALAVLLLWGGGWIYSSPVANAISKALIPESYTVTEPSEPITEPSQVTEPSSTTMDYLRPEPYTLETAPAPSRISGKVSALARLIDDIRYAQAYGYSAVGYIFKLYGAVFLYIVLALIALPLLWRRVGRQSNLGNLASLYGPLAGIALVIIALLFTGLGFGPLRLISPIILICTTFVGFIMYEIIEKSHASHWNYTRIIVPLLVAIILIGAFGHSTAKIYESPYVLEDNPYATQTEISGVDWLFNNKNEDIAISSHCFALGRFGDFLLTRQERIQRRDIPSRKIIYHPTEHFCYNKGAWLGECYDVDNYLVLGQRDRLRYIEVYPELAKYRYYPEDFARLAGDPTVDKLYSNGALDVYYIRAVE
jgi:hypothetical protein